MNGGHPLDGELTALLVTSNGVGMGHLSRQLSVGLAAPAGIRPVIFSMSLGLPQVLGRGVDGEYCPSYDRRWIPDRAWDGYLRRRVVAIAREVEADAVLFDGVAPYRGLISARPFLPGTSFVWMRRGMWASAASQAHLQRSAAFDIVLEPGDLGGAGVGATAERDDADSIPPVSMLEVIPRLDRREAAARLGLDPDRPTVLVTLGSGRLGDASAPRSVVLETLATRPDWQVAVTRSAIAASAGPATDRVVDVVGVFPLVEYLAAFDAVVSAAGYNAVHEFVSGGLPTLLVPNEATRTDGQVARASGVAARGLSLIGRSGDPAGLKARVEQLLDQAVRRDLTAAISALHPGERMGGAAEAGRRLRSAAGRRPEPSALARGTSALGADVGRSTARRILGRRGTAFARGLMGRPAPTGRDRRMRVTVAERPGSGRLWFTERLDVADVMSGDPVEHLLAGSSAAYRAARMRIAGSFYRIASDSRVGPPPP